MNLIPRIEGKLAFTFILYVLYHMLFPLVINNYTVNILLFIVFFSLFTILPMAIFFGIGFATNNWAFAGAFTTVIVNGFFVFGRTHDFLRKIFRETPQFARYKPLLLLLVLVFAGGYVLLSRLTVPTLKKFNTYTAMVAVCLLVLLIPRLVSAGPSKRFKAVENAFAPLSLGNSHPTIPDAIRNNPPNIYYVILDAYTSGNNLKKYFSYDNRWFTDELTHMGFFVSPDSKSNYTFTDPSVASALNLTYIHFPPGPGKPPPNRQFMRERLRNNLVANLLKSNGYDYSISTFSDPHPLKQHSGFFTGFLARSLATEYARHLVHISMLEPVETELLIHSLRTNVLETLEALKPPPVVGRPTFKYVHLLCPHPPFVFARDGLLPPMSTLFAGVIGDQERHNGYVNQVEFISRSVLERLKVILETDKSDPIIILQGDHGYIHRPLDHDLVKRRWSADLLQAQYGILYAVRVPKRLPMPFYNGVSPENGFRIVINSLLNLQMPMLPDRYFYSVNVEPFNFIDVTDELLRSNALEATPLPLPRS